MNRRHKKTKQTTVSSAQTRTRITVESMPAELLDMIHTLSHDEAVALREVIGAQISHLDGDAPARRVLGAASLDPDMEAGDRAAASAFNQRLFYMILSRYLFRYGGRTPPPLGKFREQRLLKDAIASIERNLLRGFRNAERAVTKEDRRQMFRYYANMVGDELRNKKRVLTMHEMLNYCSVFWVIFDESFPGYIDAGALCVLLTPDPRRSCEDIEDDFSSFPKTSGRANAGTWLRITEDGTTRAGGYHSRAGVMESKYESYTRDRRSRCSVVFFVFLPR